MLLRQRLFPGAFFAADFLRRQYRLNGVRYRELTSVAGISITRATTGYAQTQQGQLVSFPSGAARITDRGLLVEGSAVNLCLQSQTFDNASWTATANTTVAADQTTAPDGTTTADSIADDGTTAAARRVTQTRTVSVAVHTFSVYVKNNGRRYLHLRSNDGASNANAASAVFDLQSGTISGAATAYGTYGASPTAAIAALVNGWYRCELTFTPNTTSIAVKIEQSSDGTRTADGQSPSYAGTLGLGHYLWGAQLEATAYATSYIPTTSGSATRNADVISVGSVTGLTYSAGVTLFGEVELASAAAANQHIIHITNTANNAARILFNSSRVARLVVGSGGSTVVDHTGGSAVAVGAIARVAARVNTNDSNVCANGTLGTADTVCALPAADPNTFVIGDQSGTGAPLYGYIRKLAVFPSAYANAALQALAPA